MTDASMFNRRTASGNRSSCVSTTTCFAVGTQTVTNPSVPKTLIERWNGQTWKVVASPNPSTPGSNSELRAVSCTSASFCVAVGQYATTKTLIEHWNGKFIEVVGQYAPRLGDTALNLQADRVNYWLDNGAQRTDTVRSLLRKSGVIKARHEARVGRKLNAAAVPVAETPAE